MSDCITIDQSKCVGCGMCVKDCPHHAIELKDKKADMFLPSCMECGHCAAICPKAAISMNGYDMTEVKEYNKDSFSIDPDTFLNSIHFRRSVRQYKPQEVEQEKIEKIIEAGRFTPTGSNAQNVRYVVMHHPEKTIEPEAVATFQKLMRLAKTAEKVVKLPIDASQFQVEEGFFFHHAPVVIFVISENPVNAGLASENMETMAEAQGLGVLFVGLFVRASRVNKEIRRKLHMKRREKLVTAIAVGYPNVKYQRTVPRKKANVEWM